MNEVMQWSKSLKKGISPRTRYDQNFMSADGTLSDLGSSPSSSNVPIPSLNMSAPSVIPMSSMSNTGVDLGTGTNIAGYPTFDQWNANLTANPEGGGFIGGLPGVKGGWMDNAKFGLDVAKVGLGVWNAYEQHSANKETKRFNDHQIALQTQDFANAAQSYNDNAAAKEGRRISASQGIAYDDPRNKAGRDKYMENWGVKTTFV